MPVPKASKIMRPPFPDNWLRAPSSTPNWAAFEALPNVTSVVVLVTWLSLSAYTFSLPLIANSANLAYYQNPDRFGNMGPLCNLPVSTPGLACGNGHDIVKLAAKQHRKTICGCQQGLFGEALCPIHSGGFSISHYISAPAGTGAMGSLSMFPIIMMWWYQEWIEFELRPRPRLVNWSFWSLFAFQISYGMFLACTTCLDYVHHLTVVACFIVSLAAHWIVVTIICFECNFNKGAQVIPAILATGAVMVIPLAAATNVPCDVFYFGCSYGFWFMECVLLCMGFGITPVLVLVAGQKLPLPRDLVAQRRKERGY